MDGGVLLIRTKKMEQYNLKRGIFFELFSSFCFALMGMLVHAAGDLPFVEKAFFRNLIAAIFASAMISKVYKKDPTVFKIPKGSKKFILLRAICGTVGIFGNFYALDHIPISDASMLNKMSPFFSILGSFIFLGEKIELVPLLAVCGAFGGALLVIKPTFNFTQVFPGIAGFCGGIGAGLAYSFIRKCHSYKVNGNIIILFFSIFSSIICLPLMIVFWKPMTWQQFLILIGAGLAASGGQFGVTNAYFNAPATKISIYEYSMVIFAAIMGFFAFGQKPDLLSLLGYVIIIGIAILIFIYNGRKAMTNQYTRR